MRKASIKLLSLILVLTLFVTSMPATYLSAFAEGETPELSIAFRDVPNALWTGNGDTFIFVDSNTNFNDVPEITFTSSDSDVLEIGEKYKYEFEGFGGYQCLIGIKSSGTATITATTADGLSVTKDITVKAPQEISVGNLVSTNVDMETRYTFTPSQSGSYYFFTDNTQSLDGRDYIYSGYNVFDENYNYQNSYQWYGCDRNTEFGVEVYLKAGQKYTIELIPEKWIDDCSPYLTCSFGVKMLGDPVLEDFAGFYIGDNPVSNYTGFVGKTVNFDVNFNGENTRKLNDVIWTSSDPSKVEVVGSGLLFKSPTVEDVILTARINDSFDVNLPVTVCETQTIVLGELKSVNTACDFYFTPSEDGTYALYTTESISEESFCHQFNVINETDENNFVQLFGYGAGVDEEFRQEVVLNKDVTYRISTQSDANVDYYFGVQKLTNPTEVSFYDAEYGPCYANIPLEEVSAGVGTNYFVGLYFNGDDSIRKYSNDVEWIISDDSVARINYAGSDNASISLSQEGQTTLTAIVNGTITISIPIVVLGIETIGVNDVRKVSDSVKEFKFTPDVSGVYSFNTQNTEVTDWFSNMDYGHMLDITYVKNEFGINNVYYVDFYDTNGNVRCYATNEELCNEAYLDANREYNVKVYFNPEMDPNLDSSGTYDFFIEKLNAPEQIEIKKDSSIKYADTTDRMQLNCFGDNCAKYANNIEWTSSNHNVAMIDNSGYVSFVGTGFVTISAKLVGSKEIMDSMDYEVVELPEMNLNESINCNGDVSYSFTPSSSGVYAFSMNNVVTEPEGAWYWSFINVESADWVNTYSNRCYTEAKLTAGVKYAVTVRSEVGEGNSIPKSYDLSVRKLSTVKNYYIDEKSTEDYFYNSEEPNLPGLKKYYYLNANGDNVVKFLNVVKWSISDESVACIEYDGNSFNVELRLLSPGTTTLTARINGKVVAEKEITVKGDNRTIDFNQSVTFTSVEDKEVFKFVPDETGKYQFVLDYPSISWEDWDDYEFRVYSANTASQENLYGCKYGSQEIMTCDRLVAGQTYYLVAFIEDDKIGEELTLSAIKKATVSNIEIETEPLVKEYFADMTGVYSEDNIINIFGLKLIITMSDGTVVTRRALNNSLSYDGYYLNCAHDLDAFGNDIIVLNLGGCETSYKVDLGESPVTSMRVISQVPLISGVNCWQSMSSTGTLFDAYGLGTESFLIEITEGDRVYTNKDNAWMPDENSDAEIRIGYYDKNGNPVIGWDDTNIGQAIKPWTIGGENKIAISYKGYTIPWNVEMIDDPISNIEIVSPSTTKILYDPNSDVGPKELYSGRGDAGLNISLADAVLRVNYKDGTHKDSVLNGGFGNVIDGYYVDISPTDWEAWNNHACGDFIVTYLGHSCQTSIPVIESPVDSIEIIEQPNITLYLDDEDNVLHSIYEGDTYFESYSVRPETSVANGLKFRIKYKDGSYSNPITVVGNDQESVLINGYPFEFNNSTLAVFSEAYSKEKIDVKAKALQAKYLLFSYMEKTIKLEINVEDTKPINNVMVDATESLSASISAQSKIEALDRSINNLTDEQKDAIDKGSTMTTSIIVNAIDEIPEEDTIFEIATLDGRDVSMKLAIDIKYYIDDMEAGIISETDRDIVITIEIPEELRGHSSYVVYRNHNGEIEEIETTVSHDGKYITFKSDKFSDYYVSNEEKEVSSSIYGQVNCINASTSATIFLKQDGKVISSATTSTGSKVQQFKLTDVNPGIYDIVVEKAGCLTFVAKNIVVDSDDIDLKTNELYSSISTITLISGDINGDGIIDNVDKDIICNPNNYLKSIINDGVNHIADLDGSGLINEFDLNLVMSSNNYGKKASDCVIDFAS